MYTASICRTVLVIYLAVGRSGGFSFFRLWWLHFYCSRPVPVFRRLAFRTASEIDQERYALKAVRGDFDNLHPKDDRVGETEARRILDTVSR
jgi:hypothetical protein